MIANNTSGEFPPDDEAFAPRAGIGPKRKHPLARGLAVGLLLAVVISVVLAVLRGRHDVPRLTVEAYRAAVARWKEHGPANYDLDLELGGRRPGPIHVEVRGGEVTRMTRDGVVPNQKRTWDYWSVDGQLETIGDELEMANDPAKAFGAPGAARVVMWAEFDPHYGFPHRYDRVVLGADLEVHWKLVKFTPIAGKN